MSWIKKIEDQLNISKLTGIPINKWVFRIAFFILIGLFVLGWGMEGFPNLRSNLIYVYCPEGGRPCENPFAGQTSSENIDVAIIAGMGDYLPAGYVYGSPPNFILQHFSEIFFVGLILAIAANYEVTRRQLKNDVLYPLK